ncbi:MAG: DUF1810 domain-containing protein [Lachnospiraceae bacterium]|nr:DUF1810 domain-containing protein [Lachnospiraceae bacterium]
MSYDLQKFKDAQKKDYETALMEVRCGRKRSHWIWYIFPQIEGLGMSAISQYYAIADLEEARAYLRDSYLKGHLIQISEALLDLSTSNPTEVFGKPDDMKVRSCMTLFHIADPNIKVFEEVLVKFYEGKMDQRTLDILEV